MPHSIKIAIAGAGGRMGLGLQRAVLAAEDLELVAALEHTEHDALGISSASDAPPLTSDVDAGVEGADVLIDFSVPDAAVRHARAAVEHGAALLLGTTGLSGDQTRAVHEAAAQIALLHAANTSLGVNILLEVTETVARTLGADWDSEIVELHHRFKRDAPSGTALALARAVADGRGENLEQILETARKGEAPRSHGELGVFGVRGGDVAGEHTVYFFGEAERLELTHRATDRAIFVRGAITAARWLAGRAPGDYTMRDVLFDQPTATEASDP